MWDVGFFYGRTCLLEPQVQNTIDPTNIKTPSFAFVRGRIGIRQSCNSILATS